MKFLHEQRVYRTNYGIGLEISLMEGWREAAKKFPMKKGDEVLAHEVNMANSFLSELEQNVELGLGEFGLHHIHLIPEREGLDLFPDQNLYISHNLTRPHQIAAVLVILYRYLADLDILNP